MKLNFSKWPLISLVILFAISFLGCQQKLEYKPEISFYHWKSKFSLTDAEKNKLNELKVKKLYIKVFDVILQEPNNNIQPIAILKADTSFFSIIEPIPCIFIENRVFKDIQDSEIEALANIIFLKSSQLVNNQNKEIHLDCDWSKSSKDNYFQFLQKLKEISNKEITVTIRLHQIKYAEKTGIPPVKRGVLMCYNMGKIQDPKEYNSIFTLEVLKNYTKNIEKYPLELDIALPIYTWNVIFRGGKFKHIYNGKLTNLQAKKFEKIGDNIYSCKESTRLGTIPILKGDVLRVESILDNELIESIGWFSNKLHSPNYIFYHLSNQNLIEHEGVFDFCNSN